MAFRHDKRYRIWLIQKKQRERREAMQPQEPETPVEKETSKDG